MHSVLRCVMYSGWCNNWVTRQHAWCNNENTWVDCLRIFHSFRTEFFTGVEETEAVLLRGQKYHGECQASGRAMLWTARVFRKEPIFSQSLCKSSRQLEHKRSKCARRIVRHITAYYDCCVLGYDSMQQCHRTRNINILGRQKLTKRVQQNKQNSVALVRTRTIPTERPPPVGEVSANFCG